MPQKLPQILTRHSLAAGLLVLGLISSLPSQSQAATLGFQPQSLSLPQTNSFTVTVVFDTQGTSINALDGTLTLAKELGSDIQVTDSGSVITYWVTRPEFDQPTRTIKFSGAVPGGYNGSAGILFSLVIPAYYGQKLDNALIFNPVHGFVNDGLGTPAKISLKSFSLGTGTSSIDPQITSQLYIDENKPDNIPPEIFSPQVSRDDRVYDGRWFINFATTDKQSGIDHYELQETRSGGLDAGRWKVASSPYLLEDQELHSYIYVIAIDRQGNERVIKVFPRRPLSWWYQPSYLIPAVVVVLLAVGWYYLRRKQNFSTPT